MNDESVLRELVETQDEYLDFLNTANEGPILTASVHGWRCPRGDWARGVAYRERIAALKRQLA